MSVPFKSTQSAGNLNVVVVGWNDTTSRVSSVTDTKGNAYQLAVGPAAVPGALTQSIYYARNIVAAAPGANTVRVSFTAAALYPDIRILEYGGMDQLSPVDVTASAASSSQINLSWSNTSSTQTGVKVERSTDNVSFTQIAVAGATAVSYQDSGLSASATYYYRVRATNASGDSPYSNTASATTSQLAPPPSPPLVQAPSTY